MNDVCHPACGLWPRLTLAGALAAVVCLTGSAASAQADATAAVPARAVTPGGVPAGATAKLRPRTARQFAEQLVPILQQQKAPWQGYATYTRIVQEYAAREAAGRTGGAKNDAVQERAAACLRQMADLLAQMAEQAKLRDQIRSGTSTVPFAQRQVTFAKAGAEHQRLVAEFVRLAALLPRGGVVVRP